jgi:hypothetical protein
MRLARSNRVLRLLVISVNLVILDTAASSCGSSSANKDDAHAGVGGAGQSGQAQGAAHVLVALVGIVVTAAKLFLPFAGTRHGNLRGIPLVSR